jgi:hypothetical protein
MSGVVNIKRRSRLSPNIIRIYEKYQGQASPNPAHGPIVMNTREELRLAFKEYQEGTFIKHGTL